MGIGLERVGLTQKGLDPPDDPDLRIKTYSRFMGRIKKKSAAFASAVGVRVGRTKNWLRDLMGRQKKSLVLTWLLFLSSGLARVGLTRKWLRDRMGLQKKSGARFSTTRWAGSESARGTEYSSSLGSYSPPTKQKVIETLKNVWKKGLLTVLLLCVRATENGQWNDQNERNPGHLVKTTGLDHDVYQIDSNCLKIAGFI